MPLTIFGLKLRWSARTTALLRVIGLIMLIFLTGENYLRLKGYRIPDPVNGESCHLLDYDLGWVPKPGISYSPEDPQAITTVWPDGQRASRPLKHPASGRPPQPSLKILLIGCSYTFGMGVSDQETMAWKLNQLLPDVQADNHGVIGYSTYQCLLLEEKILEREHYDLVLYAAINDHILRNLSMRVFGLNTQRSGFITTPYIELQDGQYLYHPVTRLEWPGFNSFALIHFACSARIGYITEKTRLSFEKHGDERYAVMASLLQKMSSCAANHGSRFALVALDGVEGYRLEPQWIDSKVLCDASFPNINAPENRVKGRLENHPKAQVHTFWAEKIAHWLKQQKLVRQ